jgi:outer membrane PBP1 activator LpoA protein
MNDYQLLEISLIHTKNKMNQAKEKINKIPHHTDSATNVLVQI